jgi:hypothetical protein
MAFPLLPEPGPIEFIDNVIMSRDKKEKQEKCSYFVWTPF